MPELFVYLLFSRLCFQAGGGGHSIATSFHCTYITFDVVLYDIFKTRTIVGLGHLVHQNTEDHFVSRVSQKLRYVQG